MNRHPTESYMVVNPLRKMVGNMESVRVVWVPHLNVSPSLQIGHMVEVDVTWWMSH